MPLGAGHVTTTTAATFIPEIWSNEVKAEHERNLVVKPLVKSMSMTGKRGDTIRIPIPVRGDASAKAPNAQVTLVTTTEQELIITIDQHWEYSRHIEDVVSKQAHPELRSFYTEDAGYALPRLQDTQLIAEADNFDHRFQAVASGQLAAQNGTATAFNDHSFRAAIQKLDESDVPGMDRCLVVSPAVKNVLMSIDRYNSRDFVNSGAVVNGEIGELYGVKVYCTTNLPAVNTDEVGVLLFHKDAIVMAEQMSIRVQTQYQQDYLADLLTSDVLFGTSIYRPENGVQLNVLNEA